MRAFPNPPSLETQKPIQRFYIGLDDRFATTALTAPTGDVFDLPDNPVLGEPNKPVVMDFKNNGYLVQSDIYESGWTSDFDKKPELELIEVGGKLITARELEDHRTELIEAYLIGLLGSTEALAVLRRELEVHGIAKDAYLYRAPGIYDRYKGKVVLLNHLDPSTNFETEAEFGQIGSQVRHFATDPDYSGEIVRIKIEEPAFYRPAGMPSAPRTAPMFPHYVNASQIEVSNDMGSTWQPSPAN